MQSETFPVGSMVKFTWWTEYTAPTTATDHNGHVVWCIIKPGDVGVVISRTDESHLLVIFSNQGRLATVNQDMLDVCDS